MNHAMVNIGIMRNDLPLHNGALDDLRRWWWRGAGARRARPLLLPLDNPNALADRRRGAVAVEDAGADPRRRLVRGGSAGRPRPGARTHDARTKPLEVWASARLPHTLDGAEANVLLCPSLGDRADAPRPDDASLAHADGAGRSPPPLGRFDISLSEHQRAWLGTALLAEECGQTIALAVPLALEDADGDIVVTTPGSLPVLALVESDSTSARHGGCGVSEGISCGATFAALRHWLVR